MDGSLTYYLIIAGALVLILSHFFNVVSKKTSIPSVLMLIVLGFLTKQVLRYFDIAQNINWMPGLAVIGTVALIMIVLEGALELELKKEKIKVIGQSLLVAGLGLVVTVIGFALLFKLFFPEASQIQRLLYATPPAVLSSAIIIPSVRGLKEVNREFHIYESIFSDILGILLFYFFEYLAEHSTSITHAVWAFSWKSFLTVIVSIFITYILILVFQQIKSAGRLFLLIASLLLMYAAGKLMHPASLLIILVFGLVLKNRHLFFRGFMANWLDDEKAHHTEKEFHLITAETAFVFRSFFFFIFGITISLSSLWDVKVILIGFGMIALNYILRLGILFPMDKAHAISRWFIAPRGLITILLAISIPESIQIDGFNQGILLLVILVSSVLMAIQLITEGQKLVDPIPEETIVDDLIED